MPGLQLFEVQVFKLFLLVLVRIGGLLFTAPLLGSANFPIPAKIGLAVMIAVVVTPIIGPQKVAPPDDVVAYALMAGGELAIGMLMGFVMTLVFAAIQVAGQILDMQSGFGMMNVFNPALETQFPIFGFFMFIIAVLFLLVTNMHHLMLRAIISTFDRIPLGGFVARPALLWQVSQWGRVMFVDGLIIATPVAAGLMVAYIVMGIVGRVVPQIQLFVIGFPVTIAMSLFIMGLSIAVYIDFIDGMFTDMFRDVSKLIGGMT